jgi:hypothetical protein
MNEKNEIEQWAERIIDQEVWCCDSSLIEDLMRQEVHGFSLDDVANLYPDPGETADDSDPESPQEVMQWFRVDCQLARDLESIGEPVLVNDYGCWWGRTCCGQALSLDGTFQRVAELREKRYREAVQR